LTKPEPTQAISTLQQFGFVAFDIVDCNVASAFEQ